MLVHNPRMLLLRALFLDWIGQLLLVVLISLFPVWFALPSDFPLMLESQGSWLILCLLLYALFGWLFGSYTTLRRLRLGFPILLQRVLITSTCTFIVIVITCFFLNPGDHIWLVDTRVELFWFSSLSLWSLFIRIAIRRGFCLTNLAYFFLPVLTRLGLFLNLGQE